MQEYPALNAVRRALRAKTPTRRQQDLIDELWPPLMFNTGTRLETAVNTPECNAVMDALARDAIRRIQRNYVDVNATLWWLQRKAHHGTLTHREKMWLRRIALRNPGTIYRTRAIKALRRHLQRTTRITTA